MTTLISAYRRIGRPNTPSRIYTAVALEAGFILGLCTLLSAFSLA